jgi:hypothetical protein
MHQQIPPVGKPGLKLKAGAVGAAGASVTASMMLGPPLEEEVSTATAAASGTVGAATGVAAAIAAARKGPKIALPPAALLPVPFAKKTIGNVIGDRALKREFREITTTTIVTIIRRKNGQVRVSSRLTSTGTRGDCLSG